MYLAEEKIEPEVVENMRTWQHSGFGVDQSVFLRLCAEFPEVGIQVLDVLSEKLGESSSELAAVQEHFNVQPIDELLANKD